MEQKLNILIVHNRYKYRGGEDTVVDNEKALLEQNGHNVFVYIKDNNDLDKLNVFSKFLLPFNAVYSFRTAREVKKIIKEHKIDVVHVHNTVPLISPSVYTVAKSCGCKVVQTVHNFRFICANGLLFRDGKICHDCITKGKRQAVKHSCYRGSKAQTALLNFSIRFNKMLGSYKKIDKVIALTEFNKKIYENFFSEQQLVVKPNFCHEHNVKINPPSERKGFLYLGRVEEYKGIFELVDFFIKNPTFELTIVGTGPAFNEIKNKIENAKVGNINLVGQVDRENVANYLNKTRCLIVSSKLYEGFPMTIAEAFSMHTPVVGSNVGNVGCLCSQSVGCFDINDFDGLASYLNHLGDDGFLQEEMDKAYNLYKTKYCPKINYQQLIEIYNEP